MTDRLFRAPHNYFVDPHACIEKKSTPEELLVPVKVESQLFWERKRARIFGKNCRCLRKEQEGKADICSKKHALGSIQISTVDGKDGGQHHSENPADGDGAKIVDRAQKE